MIQENLHYLICKEGSPNNVFAMTLAASYI